MNILVASEQPLKRHVKLLERSLPESYIHCAQTANGLIDLLEDYDFQAVVFDPCLSRGTSKKLCVSRTFASTEGALATEILERVEPQTSVFAMNAESENVEEELRKAGITVFKGIPSPEELLEILRGITS